MSIIHLTVTVADGQVSSDNYTHDSVVNHVDLKFAKKWTWRRAVSLSLVFIMAAHA